MCSKLFLSFQVLSKMESNIYNGTKTDFSYFVRMALEDNMPWKTLTILLKDLAPTLNETREIISILLKQLETLQSTLYKREKELNMYQKNQKNGSSKQSQKNNAVNQNTHGSEQQSANMLEAETMDDEIEVLEVVKESIDEEMCFDMNKDAEFAEDNDEHDAGDVDESMGEINIHCTHLSHAPKHLTQKLKYLLK